MTSANIRSSSPEAELSSRYRGGLQDGDLVRIGDKDLVVSGRNPSTGKLQLRDASTMDAEEIKEQVYASYEHDIQTAWMKDRVYPSNTAQLGGSCMINGERGTYQRGNNNELICVPIRKSQSRAAPEKTQQREPTDQEWALAGPLSDSDQQIKDAAYMEYENDLVNAWRR